MFLLLLPAVVGLVAGTVAGLVGSLVVVPLITGRPPTVKSVTAMTLGFAVGGAITGLTLGMGTHFGLSSVATGTQVALAAGASSAGGTAGSVTEQVAINLFEGKPVLEDTEKAAITGSVAGLAGGTVAGTLLSPWTSTFIRQVVAMTAAGSTSGGVGKMTQNTLDGAPLLEGVDDAMLTGAALGLSLTPVISVGPRLSAAYEARPRSAPPLLAVETPSGKIVSIPLDQTVPVADFPTAPSPRWLRVGDRWYNSDHVAELNAHGDLGLAHLLVKQQRAPFLFKALPGEETVNAYLAKRWLDTMSATDHDKRMVSIAGNDTNPSRTAGAIGALGASQKD